MHVKLSGSWETIIGEQDTFSACIPAHPLLYLTLGAVHILEYENYSGYDKTTAMIRGSEARVTEVSLSVFI